MENRIKIIQKLRIRNVSLRNIGLLFFLSKQRVHSIVKNKKFKKSYEKYKEKFCSICGGEEKYAKSLNIHHLNGDHKDNNPKNLMILCSQCHAEIHQMVKKQKFLWTNRNLSTQK